MSKSKTFSVKNSNRGLNQSIRSKLNQSNQKHRKESISKESASSRMKSGQKSELRVKQTQKFQTFALFAANPSNPNASFSQRLQAQDMSFNTGAPILEEPQGHRTTGTRPSPVHRLFRQRRPGLEGGFSPILPGLGNQARHYTVDDSINIGIQQNLKNQPAQPSRIGEVL